MKKVFSLLLILIFLFGNTFTAYAEENGMSAVKHSESIMRIKDINTVTLAPTLMMGPVYSIGQARDGSLFITEPSADYKEDLYTEIVLAVLAQSVHNGAASGDLDEFMRNSLEGNDFLRCRVGHIRKVGDKYLALYFRKSPEDPRLFTVTFSPMEKDKEINKEEGAVIQLPNGRSIKVEVLAVDRSYKTAKNIFSIKEIEGYIMMLEVSQSVAAGVNIAGAVERFFTDAGFQDSKLEVLESICNRLLDGYRDGTVDKHYIKTFLNAIRSRIVEFSTDTGMSQAVQLMSGQTLTIMSWYDRGFVSAGRMSVSSQPGEMVRNEKRGLSMFSAASVDSDIAEVQNEGEAGLYWRGTERLKKLGENVEESFVYSRERFDASKENMVMYLMDHGFIPVPEGMIEATNSGRISTIHETFFLNDRLPGSVQATSTGPGHFQGLKVDIKQVSEGSGVQVNVRYNYDGEIEEVILQILRKGDMALALPGSVDYMINLGGLRFNDMSITLSPEDAHALNPDFDFSVEHLNKVEAAITEKGGIAPYLAAAGGKGPVFIPNMEKMPQETWLDPLYGLPSDMVLTEVYAGLDAEKLDDLIESITDAVYITRARACETAHEIIGKEKIEKIESEKGPTLGTINALKMYWTMNVDIIADMLGPQASQNMLVRVPVEAVEAIGAQGLKDLLAAIENTPHGYVELYTSEGIAEVAKEVYDRYGLKRKDFKEKRTRENTVTLMPVLKGEAFTPRGSRDGEWHIGDIKPADTIISPIGLNYDRAGFIRGALFGMRLSAIARQVKENGSVDEDFLRTTIDQYRSYCMAMGVKNFDLQKQDLMNIALGNINDMAQSLKRLIDLLPISPVNAEELREVYEYARKALIAA